MDVEAKIKEDMKALGCTSEQKISLALYLYVTLVDDRLMYDTEYCYNTDIDTLYIVARPNKLHKMNIYVPIPSSFDLSLDYIGKLQENLCTVETGPSINLAIFEEDFTMNIYTFTKNLEPRQSDEKATKLKLKEERRTFINGELKKHKESILNDALNGGFVDDDDCEIVG
ncbi:uncharacterized protein LOC123711480 [Pieris brassicae]|uniref:tRNA-splicing endonuclease subunit Sen15 domain-containing protein n=1 Tax=Pieris brassicae TaxID=7116 RepID=A0A9P0XC91_PIEBR|nr:uncharacterized protein LOC123711480 [Pieris brassicae]CAH4029668.1 unnamed protein product [Pieris brassicae]